MKKTTFYQSRLIIYGVVSSIVLFNVYRYVLEASLGMDSWRTGDWLINYQGGFVRRGFIGEIIYLISWNRLTTIWIVITFQCFIYLLLVYFLLKLFFAKAIELFWLLLLFSPAYIILFPFYDELGGFRKELIIFLAFVFLMLALYEIKINKKWLALSLFTYGVAVFSHEMASLCLFFYAWALYDGINRTTVSSEKLTLKVYLALFSIVAISGLTLSIFIAGTSENVAKICKSLTNNGIDPRMCMGSIIWLGYDANFGFIEVLTKLRTRAYLLIYSVLFGLAIFPIFLTNWWRTRKVALFIGFISLLPLYFVAADWGRWIYIYISLVFMVMLLSRFHGKIEVKNVTLSSVVFYSCFWSIPHIQGWPYRVIETYAGSGPGLGIIDFGFEFIPKEIKNSPLKDPLWKQLEIHYSNIKFLPLEVSSLKQNIFMTYAFKNDLKTNSNFIFPNLNSTLIAANKENQFEIISQNFPAKTFYLIDKKTAIIALSFLNFDKHALAIIDGFFVLLPNWKICKECLAIPSTKDLTFLFPKIINGSPILFSEKEYGKSFYLLDGWSWAENWGTWTDRRTARLVLPIPKGSEKIQFNFRSFGSSQDAPKKLQIDLGGLIIKDFLITKPAQNEVILTIPDELKNLQVLTIIFIFSNLRSPKELGISIDERLLGIGLESAIFYY